MYFLGRGEEIDEMKELLHAIKCDKLWWLKEKEELVKQELWKHLWIPLRMKNSSKTQQSKFAFKF